MDPNLPRAPFPAPPPFWKHFTTTNVQKLKDLESSDPTSSSQPLPLELTFLRPPPSPPPTAETYPIFNQPNFTTINPILPPSELLLFDPAHLSTSPQHNSHAILLIRLTKSLLLNFLELATILSEAPTEYEEKVEDIRRLMINVHAVINMYRPHQARENVKEMLEEMLEEGRREVEECERVKGEIGSFLGDVEGWTGPKEGELEEGMDVDRHGGARKEVENADKVSEEKLEEARRMWRLMDNIGDE